MKIPTKVKNKELVAKRREQIVLAGIKLFSRKGFHETSLRELAEESGISHGNIYDYINSKQDIFFLIHEFINNIAIEKINRSIKNIDDPLDRLRRMVRAEFDLMYEWSDAILLIYQETHILNKPLLKPLLKRERERVYRFEETIEECIARGQLRPFNSRVAANLIKSMAETWVAKRWDLRGHADRMEMEKAIIDIIINGLVKRKIPSLSGGEVEELQGKSVLIMNAGTLLGKAICFSLLSRDVRMAIQLTDEFSDQREYPIPQPERLNETKIYSSHNTGPMTPELFKRIMDEFGPIDIIIHDLGMDSRHSTLEKATGPSGRLSIKENLDCAQKLAAPIQKEMRKKSQGRIVYLAPWAWDKDLDPIGFQMAKAAIIEFTKSMAGLLADVSTTVNCIVPGYIGGVRPLKVQTEKSSEVVNNIPMGFIGEISDVLEAVNFLISDKSKYLTGQVLKVTGGME
ncbi:MAG: SDR family oxidoreductase [Desulfatiglans sp.]|jgi:AcrR family transcriptional regulator/NAD(P)-dependent dehydrogenase (short-subunit alcohol dehydrogenase family)|nr:SDR family oxidoreductase [Desulfatiglans sp.]